MPKHKNKEDVFNENLNLDVADMQDLMYHLRLLKWLQGTKHNKFKEVIRKHLIHSLYKFLSKR